MPKHQYCCQNTAQNYLDHIISVPDDFNVNPNCLVGITRQEFISGLKTLTDILHDMYEDIIKNPAEYGLPLVDDIVYSPYNPKAGESEHSTNRLITILYILANAGQISEDRIIVDKQLFSELSKAKRPTHFKLSNTKILLKKLCDFGFVYDNFTLSYPDDSNVIHALYGYMKNTPLRRYAIFSMNYYLAIAPEDMPSDIQQTIFAEYLSGCERELYVWLNEQYTKSGFNCIGDHFSLSYHVTSKEKKRALRCDSKNGKLRIECKLYNVGDYSGLIEKMPERIKNVFRNVKDCSIDNCLYKRETCICRVDWILDGQNYKACTFEHFFSFQGFEPDDLEFFKQMLSYESDKQQEQSKVKKSAKK